LAREQGVLELKWLIERKYLILVFLSLLLSLYLFWDFVVDDAYISYTYSRNLAEGHGLTYNGIQVEGYSNFIWTVLLALFVRLGIDPLVAARSLGIASSFLILLMLDRLIRTFAPQLNGSRIAFLLTTVTLCSAFAAWVVGGLETVFFSFLVVAFLYIEIEDPQRAFYLSPLVVIMLALTRPEGAMFIVILVLYRLYRYRCIDRPLISSILLFVVPFSLFLLWRYETYGYLLPNTAYVKVHTSLWTVSLAFEWLLNFLVLRPIYAFVLLISLLILFIEKKLLEHEWTLLLLVVAAFIMFVLYAGRDWMPFHRFIVPLIPVFALIMAASLERFTSGIPSIVLLGLMAGIGLFELFMSTTLYREQITDFGEYTRGLLDAGAWIRQATSRNDVIAVEDSGALAFSSERKSIDILGLNNAYIAHDPDLDLADYVLGFNPAVIQLHLDSSPTGEFVAASDSRVSGVILNDPHFSACYKYIDEWQSMPYMPYLFIRVCD
jgi:arabinofuranosyltransferase